MTSDERSEIVLLLKEILQAIRDLPEKPQKAPAPIPKSVPVAEILALYAERCPSLKQVRVVDRKRRLGAQRLWNRAKGVKGKGRAMELIGLLFDHAENSDWLKGIAPGSSGTWRADFEFVSRDATITKLMEGGYE